MKYIKEFISVFVVQIYYVEFMFFFFNQNLEYFIGLCIRDYEIILKVNSVLNGKKKLLNKVIVFFRILLYSFFLVKLKVIL